jgi:hypothetical protein
VKHVKKIEVKRTKKGNEIRVWSHAARGGRFLAARVIVPEGRKPGDAIRSGELNSVLPDKITAQAVPTS